MNLFGKKDAKESDNIFVANMLRNTADKIVKKGAYDRSSIAFLKLSLEYNVLIRKNEIDENSLLIEKLELIIKLSQENAKVKSNMKGKDTVSLFETLPDLIKSTKIILKEKARIYEEMKESSEKMKKSLDGILEELDKFENEKIQKNTIDE